MSTRKPPWLDRKINPRNNSGLISELSDLHLHTICEEALCPNISECFQKKQATFLIMGNACTRLCSFCNVNKLTPVPLDSDEPRRVAEAVKRLKLRYAVITSPTRDDLPDGGAIHYRDTVRAIIQINPETIVELLIPDFLGKIESLKTAAFSGAKVVGHNMETVPRLYEIRKGADYHRSLSVLKKLSEINPDIKTKSGLMLGLGETEDEVLSVMNDLRSARCQFLSIGQYLAPSRSHHPVVDYITPENFDSYRLRALEMGFESVESGPYVRSSYHTERYFDK